MKKLFAFMLSLVMGFTLISCNGDEDTYRVDIFIYQFSDTYIGSVRTEMESQLNQFKTGKKFEFHFHDAAASQETQNTQIDNAIAAGSDLLVVNIVETGSGDVVVGKAKDKGLPIIFFNREVSDAVIKSYDKAAFVGTDPDEAGVMQGELIAQILLEDYDKYDLNKNGKIDYIMLRSDYDNPEANGRTRYSVEVANEKLQEAGKPALSRIGEDQNCHWNLDEAKTATDSFLTSNPMDGENPIELVIANNDDMALGAIQALNGKGWNTGEDPNKTIPVVGVDATATAVQAIQAGKMAGTVKQDAVAMATCLVDMIKNTFNGKAYLEGLTHEFEEDVKKVRIPYAIYTKE